MFVRNSYSTSFCNRTLKNFCVKTPRRTAGSLNATVSVIKSNTLCVQNNGKTERVTKNIPISTPSLSVSLTFVLPSGSVMRLSGAAATFRHQVIKHRERDGGAYYGTGFSAIVFRR